MLHKYKKELEQIQKEIVNVTDLAIVIVDKNGNYVTKKENYSEYCSIFRKNKKLNQLCVSCDLKALKLSRVNKEPYIYRCHSGLIDIFIPLYFKGDYIGGIIIGQVRLEEEYRNQYDIENLNIFETHINKLINVDKAQKTYAKLHSYSYEKIKSITNMVYYTGKFIVENITQKKWEKPSMKSNIKEIDIIDSSVEPALTYIKKNINKNITLEEVAILCNMSISHFSKIFKQEVNKTFKDYLNNKRIERAKYLLEETNYRISHVAYSLGFEDTSYFTKIFKKYVQITPKRYKELFERRSNKKY